MPPSVHASPAPKLSTFVAPLAVRAVALWVLYVSFIKMEDGSPGALPDFLRNNPLGGDLTFTLTIAIEFAFSLAALVSTRVGWWLMTALLTVFLAILAHLIYTGATSCGCFGGAIKFSPYQMLAVDGPLFLVLLLARNGAWKSTARIPWALVGAALLVGAAVPWFRISNEAGPSNETPPAATAGVAAPVSSSTSNTPVQGQPDAPSIGVENPDANSAAPSTSGAWTPPTRKPRWVDIKPPEWVGKSIHDTPLGVWMDTRSYSDTGNWVLYFETCTHCRDFLNRIAAAFETDPKPYVLVRMGTKQDEVEAVIQQTPPGESAKLPPDVDWVPYPEGPPWELVLEGGIVIEAIHHDVNEAGFDKRTHWRLEGGKVAESSSQFQY
jgi:hypothetical protein